MKIRNNIKNKCLGALTLSFAMTCAMAVTTLIAPSIAKADETFAITKASVSLGNDLAISYYVTVPEGYEVTGEFTYKSETVPAGAPIDQDGTKVFRFDGITPQNMGEDVKLTVSVSNDGSVAPIEYTYSVKDYCVGVLDCTAEQLGISEVKFERMKTLATDMLNYGAAAQVYTNYKTDALVNADVVQTYASVYDEAEPVDSWEFGDSLNGGHTSDLEWFGARLRFESYIGLEVAILAQNQSADWLGVTFVNENTGEETFCNVTELTESMPQKPAGKEHWSWYIARLNNLSATDFNTVYSAYVCNNLGEKWQDVSILKYSVNSYVACNQDATANALERALFTYGKSAVGYDKADVIASENLQIEAPTLAEEGWYGSSYGGYTYKTALPTLDTAGAYEVGEVTNAVIVNESTVENASLTEGKVAMTLASNSAVAFDVSVDHVIKIDGTDYTVFNLPQNASYDKKTDTVTLNLDNVAYTGGILVWNKSLTLNLTGDNTVTGEAFVNKNGTHTVDGDSSAVEDLPYSIYTKKDNGLTKFTGEGTLTVNGMGVRMYTHAEVDGTTVNVNVDKRADGAYQGVANDIYSEGFKADGAMTLNNATLAVTATTDGVDTARMDKAGLVFAELTLNNSTVTANNFAVGAWMNGSVTVNEGSTLETLNATRYALAGEKVVTVNAGATFNASVTGNVLNPVDKMNNLVLNSGATVNIQTHNERSEAVALTLSEGVANVSVTGAVDYSGRKILPVASEAEEANGFWLKEHDTRIYGDAAPNATMSLFVTYNSTNWGPHDGANGAVTTARGYYVYTNGDKVQFLRFEYALNGWTSLFTSTNYGENVWDEQANNEFEVVYDGVRFRTSAWRNPLLNF